MRSKNCIHSIVNQRNHINVLILIVISTLLVMVIMYREFAYKSNLNTHMHIHDPQRTKDYVCQYPNCKKAFYDAQHLKQHCWTHTRSPEVHLLSFYYYRASVVLILVVIRSIIRVLVSTSIFKVIIRMRRSLSVLMKDVLRPLLGILI